VASGVADEAADAIVHRGAAVFADATFALERRAVGGRTVWIADRVVAIARGNILRDAVSLRGIAAKFGGTISIVVAGRAATTFAITHVGLALLGFHGPGRSAFARPVAGGREGLDAVSAGLIATRRLGPHVADTAIGILLAIAGASATNVFRRSRVARLSQPVGWTRDRRAGAGRGSDVASLALFAARLVAAHPIHAIAAGARAG